MLLKLNTVTILGAVIVALALLVWLWPRQNLREREPADDLPAQEPAHG
jgi:hypothetical protein